MDRNAMNLRECTIDVYMEGLEHWLGESKMKKPKPSRSGTALILNPFSYGNFDEAIGDWYGTNGAYDVSLKNRGAWMSYKKSCNTLIEIMDNVRAFCPPFINVSFTPSAPDVSHVALDHDEILNRIYFSMESEKAVSIMARIPTEHYHHFTWDEPAPRRRFVRYKCVWIPDGIA